MVESNEAVYYVRVPNSVQVRNSILEASKDAIMCLQRFEKFRTIRAEKIQAIKELSTLAKEIEKISAELELKMPQFDSFNKNSTGNSVSNMQASKNNPNSAAPTEGNPLSKTKLNQKVSFEKNRHLFEKAEDEDENHFEDIEESLSEMEEKLKSM